MAEPKGLATRGILAVVAALALSAVLFVYTGSLPIPTEMGARSAYLEGGPPAPKASETAVTSMTTQAFREVISVTTVTVYTHLAGKDVQSEYGNATVPVTTVTKTVTVTVTKTP